jgi:hypothetical protein
MRCVRTRTNLSADPASREWRAQQPKFRHAGQKLECFTEVLHSVPCDASFSRCIIAIMATTTETVASKQVKLTAAYDEEAHKAASISQIV